MGKKKTPNVRFRPCISAELAFSRVDDALRSSRLKSEFIFCSVCSVITFSAFLDSSEHAESGKNCPVKLFDVYLEILGILSEGRICQQVLMSTGERLNTLKSLQNSAPMGTDWCLC